MATQPETRHPDMPSLRRSGPRAQLLAAPQGATDRLTLFAARRMALAGLHDAVAANAMFNAFGLGFRRPLVLLRATMLELSGEAGRIIALAPGCCRRMTHDEARLLAVLRHAPADEPRARRHLARLTGRTESPRALCAASAYGWALRDLGRSLG
jgi:hypothetical protein